MEILKTLGMIAGEFTLKQKTFKNHINKDEVLKVQIKRGLQTQKKQKLFYERWGYPPGVNKADYENV